MKTLEQIIDGLVVKAAKTWNLFEPGDRVLLGASGGKDSAILAYDLAKKQRQGRLPAEILALHIRNDFAPQAFSPRLAELYAGWGVKLATIDVGVRERVKPGRTMNCYWCSTQRRTELIRYAMEHGYNVVALGHHLDDVLETLFMNMMQKSQLSTMPPRLDYDKYPLRIVRPLYLVEENQLIDLGKQLGLVGDDGPHTLQGSFAAGGAETAEGTGAPLFTTCTCGFNDNSARDAVRERVEALTGGSGARKRAILESLRNIKSEYLP